MDIHYDIGEDLSDRWNEALRLRVSDALLPVATTFRRVDVRLYSFAGTTDHALRFCCAFEAVDADGLTWDFKSHSRDCSVAIEDVLSRIRRTLSRRQMQRREGRRPLRRRDHPERAL